MDSKPAAFVAELQNDAHAGLARCVQIGLSTPVYRTLWNEPVTFDGIAYEPDEFDFGEVTVEAAGTSPTVKFRIQNVRHPTTDAARPWSAVLNSENLHGVTVTVLWLSTAILNDADACFAAEFTVLKAGLMGSSCEMDLGLPADVSRMWLPWPQIRSRRCTHEYKDGLCKSESTLKTCPAKDLDACRERHPPTALRFSQLPHDNDMRRRD